MPTTIEPAGATALTATEAWGSLNPIRLTYAIGPDRRFVFHNAATSDGRYLIGVDSPEAFFAADPTYEEPSFAVLYDVSAASLHRMASLMSPRSQMISASSEGDWVAWLEADDDPYFLNWRLRACNLATGEVKEIAKATHRQGEPVPGPLSFVSVSHGQAVWGQAINEGTDAGKMENAVVRQVDLATGRIVTLATSAGMPSLSWPWIAWGVSEGSGGHIEVANLETGFTGRLELMPPQLVLHGASAVYNDPASLSMWLIDDLGSNAPPVEIARGAHSADHLEWPTLNNRIIGWSQSLSTIVYDRAEGRLVSLPVTRGRSAVTVSGPLMIWADVDPSLPAHAGSDWLLVVNTVDLDIRP